jgi:hypothetical protein
MCRFIYFNQSALDIVFVNLVHGYVITFRIGGMPNCVVVFQALSWTGYRFPVFKPTELIYDNVFLNIIKIVPKCPILEAETSFTYTA